MTTPGRTTPAEWRARLQGTLEAFDETGGHRVLGEVLDELGVEDALTLVVLPYLHDVGERWSSGAIGVGQEHFASNVIRLRLSVLMGTDEPAGGPLAVLACMPGERHEFGLMATTIALGRLGWRTCYLGASTPTAELVHSCRTLEPDVVILSAHRTTAFAAQAPALRRLAETTPVLLAARGATEEVAGLCHASVLTGDPCEAARSVHAELGRTGGPLDDLDDLDEPTAV